MKLRKSKGSYSSFISKYDPKPVVPKFGIRIGSKVQGFPAGRHKFGTVVHIQKHDPSYVPRHSVLVKWEDFTEGHSGGTYGEEGTECYWWSNKGDLVEIRSSCS